MEIRRVVLAAFAVITLAACGGTSVGQTCTKTEDCDNAQTCYTDLPGGFCSKGCAQVGSDTDCPAGTVCSPHSNTQLCAPKCQTKAECRADYECNGITGSDLKSCRPKL